MNQPNEIFKNGEPDETSHEGKLTKWFSEDGGHCLRMEVWDGKELVTESTQRSGHQVWDVELWGWKDPE